MLIAGWHVVPDYVSLLVRASAWDDTNGISTYGMFGWNAFSRALFHHDVAARAALTVSLDVLTYAGALVAVRSRAGRSPERAFGVVVFAALLVSGHLYAHDVLVAALPILLLTTTANRFEAGAWVLFALLGWGVLYFHFDLLSSLQINATCLWLAMGMACSGVGMERVARMLRGVSQSRLLSSRASRATAA